MGKFFATALALGLGVLQCQAFNFDMQKYMKIQSMRNQFTTDSLGDEQQRALLQIHGFGDLELFMSKAISADELKKSMKLQMKDKLINQILAGGGIDINNPLWRKKFFNDKTNAELFTETMPEPMQSIVRLTKDDSPTVKDYGRDLLKKYQYRKMNKKGNLFTENLDEIMLADNKSDKIKDLFKQQMLQQIQDPIDRAMMYSLQQMNGADNDEKDTLKKDLKDLQIVKMFQKGVPDVSPVNNDDLYKFYSLSSNTEISPEKLISLAFGDDMEGVSELDFERYFGTPAMQFSCRSLTTQLRVPCGISPTADECVSAGCCYIPSNTEGVADCFHNLYGKIGTQMLREEFISSDSKKMDQIKGLFKSNQLPTLSNLLREDYRDKVYGPMSGDFTIEGAKSNWWDAAQVEGEVDENGEEINAHFINQQTDPLAKDDEGNEIPKYGRQNYKWKPHGVTVSPYLVGDQYANPTAMPGSDLDNYYQMWMAYQDTQDQAQCALINRASRVMCMENFEALVEKAEGGDTCLKAGCCFNEDAFLDGGDACYRASDYGVCTSLPSNFVKRECGVAGVSEKECLTNAKCCYKPNTEEDPWCFVKYSATLEQNEWCTAWNLRENQSKNRNPCFQPTGTSNLFTDEDYRTNINNIVSKEQCHKADCCYDEELTKDAINWLVDGIGFGESRFRCFEKENPALLASFNDDETQFQVNKEINWSEDADGNDLPSPNTYSTPKLTCDATLWNSNVFKKSCGDRLSYYQCVYANKCCYRATVSNEPTCYKPENTA